MRTAVLGCECGEGFDIPNCTFSDKTPNGMGSTNTDVGDMDVMRGYLAEARRVKHVLR